MVLVVAGCDCGSREVEFYKFGPGVDQKRPEFIEQIYECINEYVSNNVLWLNYMISVKPHCIQRLLSDSEIQ